MKRKLNALLNKTKSKTLQKLPLTTYTSHNHTKSKTGIRCQI